MVPLSFAGQDFRVVDGHALYWPAQSALLVADLHLEKASFYATHGQMLPPYDSHATLERLERIVASTGAKSVYCLGDNFHDTAGELRLTGAAAKLLHRLTAHLDWHWIRGNHDDGLFGIWGGRVAVEAELGGVYLRHAADAHDQRPEISGHFHPKISIKRRGRSVARRCFVASPTKLILPAFGALTGGMAAGDPAIHAAMGAPRNWQAQVSTATQLLRFALPG